MMQETPPPHATPPPPRRPDREGPRRAGGRPRIAPNPLQAAAMRLRQKAGAFAEAILSDQKKAGYAVLGVGLATALLVLWLAFGRGPSLDSGQPLDRATTQRLQSALEEQRQDVRSQEQGRVSTAGRAAPRTQSQARTGEAALALPRQGNIRVSQISGAWQAMIGDYIAVLQIQDGQYQLILAHPGPQLPRRYSSGTFQMMDDVLIMTPQLGWPAPAAPAGSGIAYQRLTSAPFPMIVGFQDGAMVWQNIPSGVERRIYVPRRSPLLIGHAHDYIVWKKAN